MQALVNRDQIEHLQAKSTVLEVPRTILLMQARSALVMGADSPLVLPLLLSRVDSEHEDCGRCVNVRQAASASRECDLPSLAVSRFRYYDRWYYELIDSPRGSEQGSHTMMTKPL